FAHQVEIDAARGGATFGDRPHDQRLAALHIAAREHAAHAGHPVSVAPDVAALGELDAEIGQHARTLGAEEAHGEQHELHLEGELGARDRLELEPAPLANHLDLARLERPHAAPIAAEETLGRAGIDALAALLVSARHAEDVGPLGPRIVGRALVGRARQELELVDRGGALAVHRAQAVGAGIAAADDDDALALSADEPVV